MKTLSNDFITIQISDHGAELTSIVANDKEYLWQADPKFWGRHSPVLFPQVGRVWNNVYRHEGKEYQLGQHGFARDRDFQLTYEEDNAVIYALESDEESLKVYPFPFILQIGYRLIGKKIEVMWEVENTGKKDMYFQIGAHPAFYFPDFNPNTKERCFFAFDTQNDLEYISPAEKGCVSPTRHTLHLTEGVMPVDTHTFDCVTYIFDNSQLKKVTLLDKQKKPCLSVEFTAPLVALWAPTVTHPDVPFVCIEPWYGRCDQVGYKGELKDREWMQHLEPGKTFRTSYNIIIE